MTGHDIHAYFEAHYPADQAFTWDHVGLQVGTLDRPIKKMMITLDVTLDTVKQAIEANADFILAHHPLMFHPVETLDTSQSKGQIIEHLVMHKITVYAAHTNFDTGTPGMNGHLAEVIGLENPQVLNSHEEGLSIGRIGTITPTTIKAFADTLKPLFKTTHVGVITRRPLHTEIKKVAISGGAGSPDKEAAFAAGADLFLTGDITYHTALELLDMDLPAIDIGHFAEHVFKAYFVDVFNAHDCIVFASHETSPYQWV